MKKHFMLVWLLWPPVMCTSQIGIGTTTPNSNSLLDLSSTERGFLPPRMSGQQKASLNLSSTDIGMMVYQTDVPQSPLPPSPKGLYYFDGNGWVAPLQNGTTNGQTLRWDNHKWVATTNLFNQGSSIGIGTQNPKSQVHVHSVTSPTTRLQITNAGTGSAESDGLLLGVTLSNSHAHLIQNENKPLCFGTNAVERVRIDSSGNVGIGRTNPRARLDINGTVCIGSTGTVLKGILRNTIEVEIPALVAMGEGSVVIPFPDALENASVYVSPGSAMSGLMIGYARVCTPGNVEVKFMNMSTAMDGPLTMVLNISLIQ
jgi:hypothetical protein